MTTCSYSIAIAWKTVVSQSYNLYNGMITMVNQVSSVWFDNKSLRKSLHNETNFNKCRREFTEKFCEFIGLVINSVQEQNYVRFDRRIFPLGLNTLDNARENEINTFPKTHKENQFSIFYIT